MSAELDPSLSSAVIPKGSSVEHKESPGPYAGEISAENAAYGPSGIRGLVGNSYVLGAASLASLGGFSFGYDQGVISNINVMDQFHEAFPPTKTAFGTSFMTAMLLLGAFVGCLFMPYLADKISRKRAIIIVVVIFNIGAIIQTSARSYGALVAGRAIGGIGVVISFWITYGTRYIDSDVSFRLPLGLQMVGATFLGVGISLFPYSPRWLALVGCNDKALSSLSKLRRLPISDGRLHNEVRGMLIEIEYNKLALQRRHPGASSFKAEMSAWLDLFDSKMMRRSVIACGVGFFQQFSGINAFIYYAPSLFRSIGQSDEMSLILSGVFDMLQLVAVAICFVVIDKLGRRPLAILGGFGSCACFVVIAVLAGLFEQNWSENTVAGWACVAMSFCFIMVYGVSFSPLGWSLSSEVYPNSHRAKGVALATCVNWLSNFIVGIITPPMLDNIGFGTYVFFAVFCGLAGIWAFAFVPEIKGKSLEEIDLLFQGGESSEDAEFMRISQSAADELLANYIMA